MCQPPDRSVCLPGAASRSSGGRPVRCMRLHVCRALARFVAPDPARATHEVAPGVVPFVARRAARRSLAAAPRLLCERAFRPGVARIHLGSLARADGLVACRHRLNSGLSSHRIGPRKVISRRGTLVDAPAHQPLSWGLQRVLTSRPLVPEGAASRPARRLRCARRAAAYGVAAHCGNLVDPSWLRQMRNGRWDRRWWRSSS